MREGTAEGQMEPLAENQAASRRPSENGQELLLLSLHAKMGFECGQGDGTLTHSIFASIWLREGGVTPLSAGCGILGLQSGVERPQWGPFLDLFPSDSGHPAIPDFCPPVCVSLVLLVLQLLWTCPCLSQASHWASWGIQGNQPILCLSV